MSNPSLTATKYIYDIEESDALDPRNTGGKGSGLAKLHKAIEKLSRRGLPVTVPPALVLGPPIIEFVLQQSPEILQEVKELEEKLEKGEDFSQYTSRIRQFIENIKPTPTIRKTVDEVIEKLREKGSKLGKKEPIRVAVRSSGLAEDLPTASFAGQYETILNVPLQPKQLTHGILECLASAWGDRVVDYRQKLRDQGMTLPSETEIYRKGLFSIILQIMVDSEFSGVGFSIETETGHPNVFKSTIWKGLGELGVQGKVPTVEVFAAKTTDTKSVKINNISTETSVQYLGVLPPVRPQTEMMVWRPKKGNVIVPIEVDDPKIVNDEQAQLISYVTAYLQETAGKGKPVDIEYAWEKEMFYLLQVRPETVHAVKPEATIETYLLEEKPPEENLIGIGLNVGTKITSGPLMHIKLGEIEKEELTKRIRLLKRILTLLNEKRNMKPLLFTIMTSPPWEPIMKRDLVAGIITELGNRTSHPAIISREEGLPCGVGVQKLTENVAKLETILHVATCTSCTYTTIQEDPAPQTCPQCGSPTFRLDLKDLITFDCSAGEARVYKGKYNYRIQRTVLEQLPEIRTGVAVNCGSPMEALNVSQIPGIQKVGLAREEFIAAWIQVHPTFCIRAQKTRDEGGFWTPEVKEQFPGKTNPKQEWMDRLTLGIGLIGAAFYPREVIFRLSDFKTNEYATLIGATHYELECTNCGKGIALTKHGKCPQCNASIKWRQVDLEPREANPMMGWRGVSRYLDPEFHEAFMMEVEALIQVYKKGLTTVVPMFPFVRHPEEAKNITQVVKENFEQAGLKPPKMIFMAEVPSIGFVPYLFNPYCSGYSLGTNDYTQLVTGTDRDSPRLPFNENVASVRMAIAMLADSAHREDPPREIGICGQAPSDLPAFLRFLSIYLDYVSVNPDAVVKTIQRLAEVEDELRQLVLQYNKHAEGITSQLSKEFDLWNPFNPSEPGVTEFRVKWLMRKLGIPD